MRDQLRLFLVPALVFIATGLDRQYQTDFWVHLARGKEIVRTHEILRQDPFTFASESRQIVDPNWLTQVVYQRLYSVGGINLVQLINSLALAATFGLLYRLCLRRGPSVAAMLACVLAFLGAWQTFLIRPQSFSFLLFVILYGLLDRS